MHFYYISATLTTDQTTQPDRMPSSLAYGDANLLPVLGNWLSELILVGNMWLVRSHTGEITNKPAMKSLE